MSSKALSNCFGPGRWLMTAINSRQSKSSGSSNFTQNTLAFILIEVFQSNSKTLLFWDGGKNVKRSDQQVGVLPAF